MRVEILATNRYHPERRLFDSSTEAYATWEGELPWPSVPPAGADWVHCGGWAVEQLTKVYWQGPQALVFDPDEEFAVFTSPVSIEVWTSSQVIRHLVEKHGFAAKDSSQ